MTSFRHEIKNRDHWYGTTVTFNSTDEGTRNKEQSS